MASPSECVRGKDNTDNRRAFQVRDVRRFSRWPILRRIPIEEPVTTALPRLLLPVLCPNRQAASRTSHRSRPGSCRQGFGRRRIAGIPRRPGTSPIGPKSVVDFLRAMDERVRAMFARKRNRLRIRDRHAFETEKDR